ncbi:translation initiation factor IF-2 [unidentified eubacterium SCB49]|nr:translation initiation factor IF-2 [unidentified eubacterium SCB49]
MKTKPIYTTLIISICFLLTSEILTAQNPSVTVNADPKIDKLLKVKKALEKDNKLGDGYTIQLYYGSLNQANEILKDYRFSFGTWPATIEYETPNYKVWAGNFGTHLEADRALIEIKTKFESAFILKPSK